jgi:glycerol-3-phosphate O-acyltransferase
MTIASNPKWVRLQTALHRWIQRLLKGTYHHYACYLPENPGRLLSWALKCFYRGITLAPNQTAVLKTLPRHAIPVYVTKRKSLFERLFYHTRYRDARQPVPTVAFDYALFLCQPLSRLFRMLLARLDYFCRHFTFPNAYASGYYAEALSNGQAGLLSLVEPRGFYRRFVKEKEDPIRYLLELQQTTLRPIILIPQLMIDKKDPAKANPSLRDLLFGPDRPLSGWRRVVMLIKKPGRTFVEISEPVNLQVFLTHPEVHNRDSAYQALLLRRNLLLQLHRHRQSIMGPVLKSRLEIKESVLTGSAIQAFIRQQAESEGKPATRLLKRADDYFEEIAAAYRPWTIKIYEALLTWIINTMFDGCIVDQSGLDRLKAMSLKGPLILLPCHKSHIDYLMLSYVMYRNNMPCPHIVAGKNLSFWPMGPIFRSAGAFFMRRTFKGAPLYARVFAAYVYKLLQEGFNIEVFIEGGRSRTGKLLSPKTGLLSILLHAYRRGACEDLILAPIFIGYDKVPEEKAYLHELEGGKKEPESLVQVIRARKFLKKRFGKIYIEFHAPMSLNELLARNQLDLNTMDKEAASAFCRNIGHRVINAINRITIITPHALVAAAILNQPGAHYTYGDLVQVADIYLKHLHFHAHKLADTLIMDPSHALEQAFDDYRQRKFIEPTAAGEKGQETSMRFRTNAEKRPSLEYYKNNCVACFVPAAFTALAILETDAFQFSSTDLHLNYRALQDLFKYEFAYDIEKSAEFFVRKSIKALIDEAALMPHPTLPDTYNITSAGLRKLQLYACFLKSYLESYLVVLNQLSRQSSSEVGYKEQAKKTAALGSRMLKRGEISCPEALSRVTFKNALAFLNSRDIECREDEASAQLYREAIQRYRGRLQ